MEGSRVFALLVTLGGCSAAEPGSAPPPPVDEVGADAGSGPDADCADPNAEGCPCDSREPLICFTGEAPAAPGVGGCRAGIRECVGRTNEAAGTWGPCEGEVLPEPERCNLLDDDCDGTADQIDACTPAPVETHPCVGPTSIDAFSDPVLEMHWGTEAPEHFPMHVQVVATPVVGDFVDDLDEVVPEIVIVTYSTDYERQGVLRVLDGREHEVIWSDAGWGHPDDDGDAPRIDSDAHPALGDLDGDGRPEVVVAKDHGGLLAYEGDGDLLWESDAPSQAELGETPAIAIADLEGDGVPEIVVGRSVLDWDGTLRWTGTGGRGMNWIGPISCVADLDGDGTQEIVAGQTAYRADGSILWDKGTADGYLGGGEGFCAVADFFDEARVGGPAPGKDGVPEVVRVAGSHVTILSGDDGAELAYWTQPGGAVWDLAGAPTVADFDGDGLAEIGVAGGTSYAVWDVDEDETLWEQPTDDDSSSVTASTVFDFNGDGTSEVIYNDEQYFRVYAGPDGEVLFEEPNPSQTRTEEPIVADVDADGNAEIVFVANTLLGFAGDAIAPEQRTAGLEIWGSGDDAWVPARRIWNQHSYHIDNVEEDGTIPAGEPAGWLDHDSYRANRPSEIVDLAPDLTAAVAPFDEARCYDHVLRVCASIQNSGEALVASGVAVTFYDGNPEAGGLEIGGAVTRGTLDPGAQEIVCVDWHDAPDEPADVFIDVDARDEARECDEANNVVYLGEGFCGGLE